MRMYAIKCRGKLARDVFSTRREATENIDMWEEGQGAKVVPVLVTEIKPKKREPANKPKAMPETLAAIYHGDIDGDSAY